VTTTPRQWARYDQLRQQGWARAAACREIGINYKTAQRREGLAMTMAPGKRRPRDAIFPVPMDKLCDEARRALWDFTYFQQRYFGCIPTPWQEEAANEVKQLLESPEKEYAVINAPPGGGKSTVFALHIPAWLTVQNRAIRGLLGTLRAMTAKYYLRRLKQYLETTVPLHPEAADIQKGLAVPVSATLIDDFGVFKPTEGNDVWSQDAIVVAQHGNVSTSQKEPTWTCYGMESGFLGMRFDIVLWDDLVDPYSVRTAEAREKQERWWDDVAERRLEPGGLLVLQGQRMGPDDLYRYNLNKEVAVEDDEDDGEHPERPRMYHHIVFKAHYEDRCKGEHSKTAPYYPEGCLLDPRRVTWREMQRARGNRNFATLYQQEDADPAAVLVDPLYIKGGTDPRTGVTYPGCLDSDRDICQLPHNLAGDLLSIATADPSPANFWSVQWWVVRCSDGEAKERYLMDLERCRMDAPDFLDWSEPTRSFVGLMEAWQQRSVKLGFPIQTWIVEKNGAQRFLLQYEHVRRWMSHWRVDLIPHETAANKSDPEYGVQILESVYKYGLVRLPMKSGRSQAGWTSTKLIEEVTHYPDWRYDDCVMAQWFLEWRLPSLIPQPGGLPKLSRPSWLQKAHTYQWREQWRKKVSA
jgi:hypothetical protein